MSEEKKTDFENLPQADKEPVTKPAGVSKKEFNEFKESVTSGIASILEKFEEVKLATTPTIAMPNQDTLAKIEAGTDTETPVPPAWKQLVTEILGEDFECELALPESGGSIFRVIVPKEKSNASQMHWTMFKRDVRSKELGNTGAKGVKEWCLLVRKNLQTAGMKLPVYP